MRFETKREREQRRKRQKRSAILGMVFAMLVVVGLGVLLWNGKKNIEAKNVEYEKHLNIGLYTNQLSNLIFHIQALITFLTGKPVLLW